MCMPSLSIHWNTGSLGCGLMGFSLPGCLLGHVGFFQCLRPAKREYFAACREPQSEAPPAYSSKPTSLVLRSFSGVYSKRRIVTSTPFSRAASIMNRSSFGRIFVL